MDQAARRQAAIRKAMNSSDRQRIMELTAESVRLTGESARLLAEAMEAGQQIDAATRLMIDAQQAFIDEERDSLVAKYY